MTKRKREDYMDYMNTAPCTLANEIYGSASNCPQHKKFVRDKEAEVDAHWYEKKKGEIILDLFVRDMYNQSKSDHVGCTICFSSEQRYSQSKALNFRDVVPIMYELLGYPHKEGEPWEIPSEGWLVYQAYEYDILAPVCIFIQ
jgi:hypothetical protein